jgi:SAM-dependent methyltransferase
MPGYTDELAWIHHAGFTGFARSAAPGLLEILRRSGIRSGLVVDLGCGSGVWARELTAAGYDVLGIDISPGMIRLAREHAPQAKFVTASLLAASLPACDAVTAIGECLNYSFDPGNSRNRLRRLFGRLYAALRPGGIFVFDIAEPGQAPARTWRQRLVEGDDWVVHSSALEEGRRLIRRITSFRKSGKLYRRTDEIHRLRLYPAEDLMDDLRRVGFRARLLRAYGECRLPPAHAAILARKPP